MSAHVWVCVCVCLIRGQVQRRRDQRRMSTESCDKFITHHRCDSDSSLDLAAHTLYDSVVLPPKTSGHSLPRLSAATNTDRHSAGFQSHENILLLAEGRSRSAEGYLKLNDTQDEGEEKSKGELVSHRDHTRMQDSKEQMPKDHAVSDEGHSRSNDRLCINCGCQLSSVITGTAVDHNLFATNYMDTTVAELGHSQGSAPTHKSRCSAENSKGNTAFALSKCGGQNAAPRGIVGGVDSVCDGVFAVESYSGDVSRQLCQQLVQLLSDLNMARDLNVDVCFIILLTHR